MTTSQEEQGRLPIGSSANVSRHELSGHHWRSQASSSGVAFTYGFINPFIKPCQQRRILLPGGYPRAIPILFYYPLRPEGEIKNKSGGDVPSFSSAALETSWCRSKDNPKVRWSSAPWGVQNHYHKPCFAPLQTAEVPGKKLNKIQV